MVNVTVKDVIAYENKNFVARWTTDDYIKIVLPIHPAATARGTLREHRWIMEKHLGRFLKKGEVVHHINENPHDNRIENLQLMSLEDHISYHRSKDKEERDNRVCYNDPSHKTEWDEKRQCYLWYFSNGDKSKPICRFCHSKEYRENNREALLKKKREYYQKNRERIIKKSVDYKRKKREKNKLPDSIT